MTRPFVLMACLVAFAGCAEEERADLGLDCTAIEFEPCGGDLAGTTWAIASSCISLTPADDVSSVVPDCPEAETFSRLTPIGSYAYGDDGFAEFSTFLRTVRQFRAPESCRLEGETCLEMATRVSVGLPTPITSTPACIEEDDGTCQCTLTETQDDVSGGPYAIEGTQVIVQDGAFERRIDYCVTSDGDDEILTLSDSGLIDLGPVDFTIELIRVR